MHPLLVCPNCKGGLVENNDLLDCAVCRVQFPVAGGIPILLPRESVFSTEQITASNKTFYADKAVETKQQSRKSNFRKILPKLTKSWERARFYEIINGELKGKTNPIGLQLGAGEVPTSITDKIHGVEWIHSDVDLAFQPDVIADAAGIPLPTESVDIVFADNVLEHVFDLAKSVAEIQRVLKPGALVAVGVPFLYPFHGVPYDFTRLTPCGLRASFNQTENLFLSRDSGAFVALALQLDARLVNTFQKRALRGAATVASRLLFSHLKHLDRVYTNKWHISTAAALLYVGRKSERVFSPREIMQELHQLYRV